MKNILLKGPNAKTSLQVSDFSQQVTITPSVIITAKDGQGTVAKVFLPSTIGICLGASLMIFLPDRNTGVSIVAAAGEWLAGIAGAGVTNTYTTAGGNSVKGAIATIECLSNGLWNIRQPFGSATS